MKQPQSLEHLTQVAYETFLGNIEPFAPELSAMQPSWALLPEVLRVAWRNAVQAALAEAAEGDA